MPWATCPDNLPVATGKLVGDESPWEKRGMVERELGCQVDSTHTMVVSRAG